MATIFNSNFGSKVAVAAALVLASQGMVLAKGFGGGGMARFAAPRVSSQARPINSNINLSKVATTQGQSVSSALTPSNSQTSVYSKFNLGKYAATPNKNYSPEPSALIPGPTASPYSKFVNQASIAKNLGKGTKSPPSTGSTPTKPPTGSTPTGSNPSNPTDPTKGSSKGGMGSGIGSQLLSQLLSSIGGGAGGGDGGGDSGGGGGGDSSASTAAPDTSAVAAQQPAVEQVAQQSAAAQPSGSPDLLVEDIAMTQGATLIAGPAYRVKFRNQGLEAAGQFRVGIFAMLDGKMSDAQALVEVPGLAAGEEREVTLRLPISSMRLASTASAQPTTFNQLLVAVDPDGVVQESDKTNNVAAVERTALEK